MGNLSNWEKSNTLEELYIHRVSQNYICFMDCNKLTQSLLTSSIRPDVQFRVFAILARLTRRMAEKITTLFSTFIYQCNTSGTPWRHNCIWENKTAFEFILLSCRGKKIICLSCFYASGHCQYKHRKLWQKTN